LDAYYPEQVYARRAAMLRNMLPHCHEMRVLAWLLLALTGIGHVMGCSTKSDCSFGMYCYKDWVFNDCRNCYTGSYPCSNARSNDGVCCATTTTIAPWHTTIQQSYQGTALRTSIEPAQCASDPTDCSYVCAAKYELVGAPPMRPPLQEPLA